MTEVKFEGLSWLKKKDIVKISSWKCVGNLLLGIAKNNFSAVLAYIFTEKKFIDYAEAFLSILKKYL